MANRDMNVTEMFCGSIGQGIFMSIGYICVFFLIVEFAAVMIIQEVWCYYLWLGIPVGTLLMAADGIYIFKNKEKIDQVNSIVLYAWALALATAGHGTLRFLLHDSSRSSFY